MLQKFSKKYIFCDQFYEYLSVNDLISHQQSGFRPTYSTVTALLKSTNDWCVNIDNGLVNGVIFIDLKNGSARMYADDTNITFHSRDLSELEAQ